MISSNNTHCYMVYGRILESEVDLSSLLLSGEGPADIHFHLHKETPTTWPAARLVFKSPYKHKNGHPLTSVWHTPGYLRISLYEEALFEITSKSIHAYLKPLFPKTLLPAYLLGTILSLWLELNDIPTLHASAIVHKNRAIAFLANSGGGKSSLASSLVKAGYPLLTDDVLPVERKEHKFYGMPGFPIQRLGQPDAQLLLGARGVPDDANSQDSKWLIPINGNGGVGKFCSQPQPLGCIYILERCESNPSDQPIIIEPVPPSQAVVDLLRFSFTPNTVQAIGLAQHRLAFFSQLVQRTPVRRLRFQAGFSHLPDIRQAILKDAFLTD